MKIGKLRDSRIARAKLNLLSWSGRVDWSPPPVPRKVLFRIEPDKSIRVSLWPSKIGVEDKFFRDRAAATFFAAGLSLEHQAEIDHA